ncbi:MAG: zinc-ribbon domain-containing protein [Acidaminococcaceae bacterium]|nr:zinc-ribbon domain-containing protein [Acidaminococcaceae bacterium]
MQINGSGGCFEERIYEIEPDVAWQVGLLVAAEMAVNIEERNDKDRLLNGTIASVEKALLTGKRKTKLFTFSVQVLDKESCQIILDIRKEQIEVYSFRPQNKEAIEFFKIFDKKLKEYAAFILCPSCRAKISSSVKFCPECGVPVK